jgi:hypothetical protein
LWERILNLYFPIRLSTRSTAPICWLYSRTTAGQLTLMSSPVPLSRQWTSVIGYFLKTLTSYVPVYCLCKVWYSLHLHRCSSIVHMSFPATLFSSLFHHTKNSLAIYFVEQFQRCGILFNEVLRPVATTSSNCQRKSYGSDLSARIS